MVGSRRVVTRQFSERRHNSSRRETPKKSPSTCANSVRPASQATNKSEDQIRIKKEQEMQKKAKILEEDARKEREIASYNPYGKGGAGAPLRDVEGKIVTNTSTYAKQVN